MGTLTYGKRNVRFLGGCLLIDIMKPSDRLKRSVREFIRAIDKSKSRLAVRCVLCVDIVWYRQMKHIRKIRNNGKRV